MDRTVERSRSPAAATALLIARAVLVLAGTVTLVGAVYFTFFAAAEDGGVSTAGDRVVAIVAIALGVAYVIAGFGLGRYSSPRAVLLTAAVVVAHIVFGMVKLIGYDEIESVPFFVADLVILASLVPARRGPGGPVTRPSEGDRRG